VSHRVLKKVEANSGVRIIINGHDPLEAEGSKLV
jgi:hypothetical protein